MGYCIRITGTQIVTITTIAGTTAYTTTRPVVVDPGDIVKDISVTDDTIILPVTPGTTYIIQYRESGHANWTTVNITVEAGQTQLELPGLVDKSKYDINITSIDEAGVPVIIPTITLQLGVSG